MGIRSSSRREKSLHILVRKFIYIVQAVVGGCFLEKRKEIPPRKSLFISTQSVISNKV